MWQKIRPFFTVIGFLTFLLILLGTIGTALTMKKTSPPLPDQVVLGLFIDNQFLEQPQISLQAQKQTPSIHQLSLALNQAAQDDRVKSLYIRMKQPSMSLSNIQELKPALDKMKENGKPLYLYAESYQGFGSGISSYYFASFFDEIWLQPTGSVDVSGIQIQIPFFRSVLDKIGITPELSRREAYKSAPESMLFDEITPENKQMMTRLSNDLYQQLKEGILTNRPILKDHWEKAVKQSPLTDQEAESLKLITQIGYFDEFANAQKKAAEEINAEAMPLWDYIDRDLAHKDFENAPKVGFVVMDGTIPDPAMEANQTSIGGDALIIPHEMEEALYDIAEQKDIDHVLIRINSPGGSPSGAETIRRAIEFLKSKGKTIYLSMGNAVASGGYWVAVAGDKLYANQGTLTGSIGVYGGKASLENLWKNIGVNWEHISAGSDNLFWSPHQSFSPEERKKLEKTMDNIYDAFLERVSQGRGLSETEARQVAGGRVWTGKEALENGLIDKEGGMIVVLNDIKAEMGLKQSDRINLIAFPKPKSPIEQALELLDRLMSMGVSVSSFWSHTNIAISPNVKAYSPEPIIK